MEKITNVLTVIWGCMKKLWGYLKLLPRFVSYWLGRLKNNTKAFFQHPVQFIKSYIQDFKEASVEKKVTKVLLTIAAIYALCVATYVVVMVVMLIFVLVVCFGLFGGGSSNDDWEFARWLYKERHDGAEPTSWVDVYE